MTARSMALLALGCVAGACSPGSNSSSSGSSSSGSSSSSTSSSSSSSSGSSSVTALSGGAFPYVMGGTQADTVISVALDRGLSVYALGQFTDALTLGGTAISPGAGVHHHLVAISYDGTLRWLKVLPADGVELVSTSLTGNGETGMFVVGNFSGAMTVDATTLTSAGARDVFILHILETGELEWARRYGGSGDDVVVSVNRYYNGVAVAGSFEGTVDIATGLITSHGGRDGWVLNVSEDGTMGPVFQFGGAGEDDVGGAVFENSGNLLVAGSFQGTMTANGVTITASGAQDIFLADVQVGGNQGWMRSLGGTGVERATQLAVPYYGDAVAMLGSYTGVLTDGTATLPDSTAPSGFVAMVNARGGGELQWWAAAPGALVLGMSTNGDILAGGDFQGTLALQGQALSSAGGSDLYVARWDHAGQALGVEVFGGTGNDVVRTLCVNGMDQLLVGGSFEGTLPLGGHALVSSGGQDGMVFMAP